MDQPLEAGRWVGRWAGLSSSEALLDTNPRTPCLDLAWQCLDQERLAGPPEVVGEHPNVVATPNGTSLLRGMWAGSTSGGSASSYRIGFGWQDSTSHRLQEPPVVRPELAGLTPAIQGNAPGQLK